MACSAFAPSVATGTASLISRSATTRERSCAVGAGPPLARRRAGSRHLLDRPRGQRVVAARVRLDGDRRGRARSRGVDGHKRAAIRRRKRQRQVDALGSITKRRNCPSATPMAYESFPSRAICCVTVAPGSSRCERLRPPALARHAEFGSDRQDRYNPWPPSSIAVTK